MKKLNEKTWLDFSFPKIFDIKKGFYNKKPETDGDGTIPFLGATDSNNGITRFLTIEEIDSNSKTGDMNNASIEKKIFDGSSIAVTNNGSLGHAYYQVNKFTCSHDLNPLYLKDHTMNQEEALFLIKAIEKQGELFQYARKWRPKRMIKSRILLPVNENNDPDYAYMEEYAKNKREELISRYKAFVKKRMEGLEYKEIPALDEKEWNHFLMPEIFPKIQRGKRFKKADHELGDIPYVSSTALNNGIDGYVKENDGTRVFNDCISLANSGSVGTAFYEPFRYVASDHVTCLKRPNTSQYIYLFLVTQIEKQGSNFNFNREINDARIKKMQVMLPITDQGEPDYEYMEQYTKNMMLKKYMQYLKFLEKQEAKENKNV